MKLKFHNVAAVYDRRTFMPSSALDHHLTVATVLIFLLLVPILRADPASTPKSPDPLTDALPILRAKYLDFKSLHYQPGDHLADLIARSDGRITLDNEATSSAPITTASLPDDIVYWRLATFTPEKSWLDLATQLAQSGAAGIVLDLRSNLAPDDYAGAAQVMNFFAPTDFILSKFHPRNADGSGTGGVAYPDTHGFHAPMIVLTNNQTTGAAEALAACLQADGALIIGRATAGRAAVFATHQLPSGQILRYATADVFRAGSALWDHPVVPDITPKVNDKAEKVALLLIQNNHVLDLIQESPERHRMSEAALIRGDDPEWDAYLDLLENKRGASDSSPPPAPDVVLVAALDSLKAILVAQAQAHSAPPVPPVPTTLQSAPSTATTAQ